MSNTYRFVMRCVVPVLAGLAGCALPSAPQNAAVQRSVSLAAYVDENATLEGVSADPHNARLHVLASGQGLMVIEDDELVERIDVGTRGLPDLPYRDLVSLGESKYLLIADEAGYLYDADTESMMPHFCVEPGFAECFDEAGALIDTNSNGVCDFDEAPKDPEQPVLVQRNDALALVGDSVLAAPRFYEQGKRVEASLRTYAVATGAPAAVRDLSLLDVELLALVADGGEFVGSDGDRLVRFDGDGNELSQLSLPGMQARGLAGGGDAWWVLDEALQALHRVAWE